MTRYIDGSSNKVNYRCFPVVEAETERPCFDLKRESNVNKPLENS